MFNKINLNILFIFLAVCFLASGGVFVKLSALPPINTAMYRVLFSIVLLYPFLKKTALSRKQLMTILLSGVFLGLDLIVWNVSATLTTLVNSNLLANLVPFTIVPVSYFFFKEKIKGIFFLGLFLTLIGLFFLVTGKESSNDNSLLGDFLAFATSVFYAFFILVVYQLRKKVDAITIMYYSAYGSLIVLLPASIIFEGFKYPSAITDFLPLIGLALFSQILGQGLMSYCLGKIKPLLASIIVLSQPVVAAIYGYFIFDQRLSLQEILAIVIILVGIFIAKKSI